MEGKRFVETERTYRLSSDVVRHGLDQSSSLSVHQSPLSQQCKHRKRMTCGKILAGQSNGGIWNGVILVLNPVWHQLFRAMTLVCVSKGRSVALNVSPRVKVRLE